MVSIRSRLCKARRHRPEHCPTGAVVHRRSESCSSRVDAKLLRMADRSIHRLGRPCKPTVPLPAGPSLWSRVALRLPGGTSVLFESNTAKGKFGEVAHLTMSLTRQTMSLPRHRLNPAPQPGSFPATATPKKRGKRMISAWWMIAASWIGGCAGVLAMVLMRTSSSLPTQSTPAPHPNRLH